MLYESEKAIAVPNDSIFYDIAINYLKNIYFKI